MLRWLGCRFWQQQHSPVAAAAASPVPCTALHVAPGRPFKDRENAKQKEPTNDTLRTARGEQSRRTYVPQTRSRKDCRCIFCRLVARLIARDTADAQQVNVWTVTCIKISMTVTAECSRVAGVRQT